VEVRSLIDKQGAKILGFFFGDLYSIQTGVGDKGALFIQFRQHDQVLACFEFEDTLRTEVSELLKTLSRNYSLGILSGDREDRVQSIAWQISVPFSFLKGNCTSEEKSQWISEHPRTLMLGDGVNDLAALSKAHVGVVVQGPLVHGLRAGSVYFLKPGLKPLETLLSLSHQTKRLIRRNLSFALAYNLSAGLAALLGWINPLVAALLMPISSLFLLASTWRASK
jgi:P-type E1-E2 ATPase